MSYKPKHRANGWALQRKIIQRMTSTIIQRTTYWRVPSVQAIKDEADKFPQNLKQYYADTLLLSYVRKTFTRGMVW